ncbi:hypothetical protein N7508_007892 [Penicillium antarcticum]|uniref:uncharacterized protein n=1 Tax=Penicillium antarcticum TaxID=416450 RepID=UPI00239E0C91|nr:uncharacterized protein N7508_007892 [Penicillium antarcticum]KAJ5297643.1 hypothetical protein N7508_007892 [Penicillium antarcticum]
MHKVLVPSHSSAHRFACFALYRALLRQCPATNTTSWQGESRSLVKKKFRRFQKLQSPSQTTNALKAGYEALDLLSSASGGNRRDTHQITTLLAQHKSQKEKHAAMQRKSGSVKPVKPLSDKKARKAESIRYQQETARRHPNATPVLSRPRPLGSLGDKIRKVPVLVNARGIPLLRFKKPQPRNLSDTLRKKLHNRWVWIMRRERLQLDILFAKDEDEWDRMTQTRERSTWVQPVQESLDDVCDKVIRWDMKNKENAESMWRVVLAERALAEEEARQRQEAIQNQPKH